MVGKWRLATARGDRQCDVDLKEGGSAWVPTGCPDGFLPANSWRMSGGELQIGDHFDAIGTFHSVGRNRWEGAASKDGAPLVLSR